MSDGGPRLVQRCDQRSPGVLARAESDTQHEHADPGLQPGRGIRLGRTTEPREPRGKGGFEVPLDGERLLQEPRVPENDRVPRRNRRAL